MYAASTIQDQYLSSKVIIFVLQYGLEEMLSLILFYENFHLGHGVT